MKRRSCSTSRTVGLLLFLAALLTCAAQSWGQLGPLALRPPCGELLVGFFNGVNTTPDNAVMTLEYLREGFIGSEYRRCDSMTRSGRDRCTEESVRYKLFYNHIAGLRIDGVETLHQRALEFDPSGDLVRRLEILVDLIHPEGKGPRHGILGGQNIRYWEYLRQYESARTTEESLRQFWGELQTQALVRLRQNHPNLVSDLMEHRRILDELAYGSKLLLIAHSQGNLFMNEAYDYIEPQVGPDSVKAVHIAPATNTLRGPYVLAHSDDIINWILRIGKKLYGEVGVVQPPNITLERETGPQIDPDDADSLGHGLLEIYLNPDFAARDKIRQYVDEAIAELRLPEGFPPPPTDLELIRTQDSGTLFWEPPQYDMEPLACDIDYVVYRDDQDAPHVVEEGMTYFFDPYIPPEDAVCYDVAVMLRSGDESVPTQPVCTGNRVRLHITCYGCEEPPPSAQVAQVPMTKFTVKGTATGPIGAVLLPVHTVASEDDEDQTLSCPGWKRQINTFTLPRVEGAIGGLGTSMQIYCQRTIEDPMTTPFTYEQKELNSSRPIAAAAALELGAKWTHHTTGRIMSNTLLIIRNERALGCKLHLDAEVTVDDQLARGCTSSD